MVRETISRTCDGCGETFSGPLRNWWRLEAEGEHDEPKELMVLGKDGGLRKAPFILHSLGCLRQFLRRNEQRL